MNRVQRYLFFSVLQALITIVGGLALLALLAQGLSQTDLIVDNRQSALTYLWVVMLGAPQVMALLTPIAIFVAIIVALNRLHRDSEVVVAQAAGMTKWQIASPIIRLAVMAAVAHLCVNLWVQPTAQRTMRETISEARADLAAALIRPGAFTYPTEGLTLYAREYRGGRFNGLLISDTRNPEANVDYLAADGSIIEVDGKPAISMSAGQIQQKDPNGNLSTLDFDQYTFDLSPFLQEDYDLVLKASDRYLHELFFPDLSDIYQYRDRDRYFAEAHTRLSSPLLSLALATLAILAVIGGSFNRLGYQRRIGYAVAGAMAIVTATLAVQSGSIETPSLNILQYGVPLFSLGVIMFIYLIGHWVTQLFRSRNTRPWLQGAN